MPQRTASNFEIDDTAFLEALERTLVEYKATSEAGTLRDGFEIRNAAVRYAPIAAEFGGTLRASIQVTEGKDEESYFVDVGTSVSYGPDQEYGTSKMRAQPFMRPAIAEVLKVVV